MVDLSVVPMVQTAQNAFEVQQAHYIDRIAGVSYDSTPSVNHPDTSEIQSMMKHMVEKVEMHTAVLTADIEERAGVDECRQNIDDELSDLRREAVSELDSSRQDGHHRGSAGSEHRPQHDISTDPPCALRCSRR